jgi:hypothetical protein
MAVAVTKIIPEDPHRPQVRVPVTLHLTTGTWHVTGESTGNVSGTGGGCAAAATTGTILGEVVQSLVIRNGNRQDFLVDVSAASATVTFSCVGSSGIPPGVIISVNIWAVPVVMQQQ